MKQFFIIAGLLVLTLTANAGVLLEEVTHVGFAPPAHRGVFKFQILESGIVQKITNKGEVVELAQLSQVSMDKLNTAVAKIKKVKLNKPTGPMCMDAPTSAVLVKLNNGEVIEIYKRMGCKNFEADDFVAKELAKIVLDLQNTLTGLDYIEQM